MQLTSTAGAMPGAPRESLLSLNMAVEADRKAAVAEGRAVLLCPVVVDEARAGRKQRPGVMDGCLPLPCDPGHTGSV